jgi:anti-sigma factor RsiW
VSTDELRQLIRGDPTPADVVVVCRHIAVCAECLARSRSLVNLQASVSFLRASMDSARRSHPNVDSDLFGYVDGTIDKEARRWIHEHVAHCARCRQDVDDLTAEEKHVLERREVSIFSVRRSLQSSRVS